MELMENLNQSTPPPSVIIGRNGGNFTSSRPLSSFCMMYLLYITRNGGTALTHTAVPLTSVKKYLRIRCYSRRRDFDRKIKIKNFVTFFETKECFFFLFLFPCIASIFITVRTTHVMAVRVALL